MSTHALADFQSAYLVSCSFSREWQVPLNAIRLANRWKTILGSPTRATYSLSHPCTDIGDDADEDVAARYVDGRDVDTCDPPARACPSFISSLRERREITKHSEFTTKHKPITRFHYSYPISIVHSRAKARRTGSRKVRYHIRTVANARKNDRSFDEPFGWTRHKRDRNLKLGNVR